MAFNIKDMKKNLEERIEIDRKRKNALFDANELRELAYWLTDGYKECDGRTIAIDLLNAEIKNQQELVEKYYKELFE